MSIIILFFLLYRSHKKTLLFVFVLPSFFSNECWVHNLLLLPFFWKKKKWNAVASHQRLLHTETRILCMWNASLGQSKLLQISIHIQELKPWSHLFRMDQGILQQVPIALNPRLMVPPRMVARGSPIPHQGRGLPRDWTLSKKRRWLSKSKKVKFWRLPLSMLGRWQKAYR